MSTFSLLHYVSWMETFKIIYSTEVCVFLSVLLISVNINHKSCSSHAGSLELDLRGLGSTCTTSTALSNSQAPAYSPRSPVAATRGPKLLAVQAWPAAAGCGGVVDAVVPAAEEGRQRLKKDKPGNFQARSGLNRFMYLNVCPL